MASGRTPAKQRWFRRALRKRGLSESVSVSPGRNRLGPPKRCNWVGPFLRNKGISTLEKDLESSEIIAQIVSCRACRRRRRRPSADERMQKSMDCFRITSSAAPPTKLVAVSHANLEGRIKTRVRNQVALSESHPVPNCWAG